VLTITAINTAHSGMNTTLMNVYCYIISFAWKGLEYLAWNNICRQGHIRY